MMAAPTTEEDVASVVATISSENEKDPSESSSSLVMPGSNRCRLLGMFPFTRFGVEDVSPAYFASHVVALLLAVDHFNDRNPLLVPDLRSLTANCTLQIDSAPLLLNSNQYSATVAQELTHILWNQQQQQPQAANPSSSSRGIRRRRRRRLAAPSSSSSLSSLPWCGWIGPYSFEATATASSFASGWNVPLISPAASQVGLTDAWVHPNVVLNYPDYDAQARAMVSWMQDRGRTDFWGIIHVSRGLGVELTRSLQDAVGLQHLRHVQYYQFLPPFTDYVQDRGVGYALRDIQRRGYRNILVVLTRPNHLEYIATVAERHGMNRGQHVWMLAMEVPSLDQIVDYVHQEQPHNTNLTKLLHGMAVVRPLDGFVDDYNDDDDGHKQDDQQDNNHELAPRKAKHRDSFLHAWKMLSSQDNNKNVTLRANAIHPMKDPDQPGYFRFADDYFQQYPEPSPGSAFVYDAVMQTAIGNCRVQQQQQQQKPKKKKKSSHQKKSSSKSSSSYPHALPASSLTGDDDNTKKTFGTNINKNNNNRVPPPPQTTVATTTTAAAVVAEPAYPNEGGGGRRFLQRQRRQQGSETTTTTTNRPDASRIIPTPKNSRRRRLRGATTNAMAAAAGGPTVSSRDNNNNNDPGVVLPTTANSRWSDCLGDDDDDRRCLQQDVDEIVQFNKQFHDASAKQKKQQGIQKKRKRVVRNPQVEAVLGLDFQGATGQLTYQTRGNHQLASRFAGSLTYGVYNFRTISRSSNDDDGVVVGEDDKNNNKGLSQERISYFLTDTLSNGTIRFLSTGAIGGTWEPTRHAPFIFASHTTEPPELNADIPEQNYLSGTVHILGLFLFALAAAASIASLGLVYQKRKTVVLVQAQPPFLGLMLVGCLMLSLAILMFSFDEGVGWSNNMLDWACTASVWFISIGYNAIYGALACKMWRINRVLQPRRRKVTMLSAMLPFVVVVFCNIIVLLLWTLLDPFVWERRTVDEETREEYGQCQSENTMAFITSLGCLMAATAVACAVMAWKTKDIDRRFAESSWIFYTIFVQIQVLLLGVPIMIILDTASADATYLGRVIVLFSLVLTTIVFMIGPKAMKVLGKSSTTGGSEGNAGTGSRGGVGQVRISGLTAPSKSMELLAAAESGGISDFFQNSLHKKYGKSLSNSTSTLSTKTHPSSNGNSSQSKFSPTSSKLLSKEQDATKKDDGKESYNSSTAKTVLLYHDELHGSSLEEVVEHEKTVVEPSTGGIESEKDNFVSCSPQLVECRMQQHKESTADETIDTCLPLQANPMVQEEGPLSSEIGDELAAVKPNIIHIENIPTNELATSLSGMNEADAADKLPEESCEPKPSTERPWNTTQPLSNEEEPATSQTEDSNELGLHSEVLLAHFVDWDAPYNPGDDDDGTSVSGEIVFDTDEIPLC